MKDTVKNYSKNNLKNGQALLFVIVAMTIAMALGINVSVRTLSSISRTTNTDTSERLRAAAEGAAERTLVLPKSVLDNGISNSTDCAMIGGSIVDSQCVVDFTTAADNVTVKATVVVENFSSNNQSNGYEFKIEDGTVAEMNVTRLDNEAMSLCWNGNSDIYYMFYGDDSVTFKGGLSSGAVSGTYQVNGFSNNVSSQNGFEHCNTSTISVPSGSKSLRIRSLGADSSMTVARSDGNSLPDQGHKITSYGQLIQAGQAPLTKKVTVYRSYPYTSGLFDLGVYSGSGWSN